MDNIDIDEALGYPFTKMHIMDFLLKGLKWWKKELKRKKKRKKINSERNKKKSYKERMSSNYERKKESIVSIILGILEYK